jgi:hypothetical protein
MNRGDTLRKIRSALLISSVLLSIPVFAKDDANITQVGHAINVGPDQKVGELTCFGCTIRIRGEVTGDVTTFGGSITIEGQGQVAGDVTSFGGDLRLEKETKIFGDVAVFGGQIRRDPQASIGGDVTSMAGTGWILLIVVLPFAMLGALIAFIVWLVRRLWPPAVSARTA